MTENYYIALLPILLVCELVYFKVAAQFQIIDKPNDRSSHTNPTIRGGGIIFVLAFVFWYTFFGNDVYLLISVIAIAVISFLDDIKPQRALVRFSVQAVAVILCFYSLSLFTWPWWLASLALIICIGSLNAFNFMDGINGITGLYALVNLVTFMVINQRLIAFTSESLLITLLGALLLFLFFNFRRKAKSFAGDVGSITIAFLQIFLLLQLISASHNFLWVIMFLVFGYDAIFTIVVRIRKKENIFKAHRQHLYQYLANEMKWDHRLVSFLYALAQLAVNVVLIASIQFSFFWFPVIGSLVVLVAHLKIRSVVSSKVKSLNPA